MLNELLSAKEIPASGIYSMFAVARVLGITTTSVRRLIRQGLLKALRRRRSIIGITHPALEDYLSCNDDVPLSVVVKHGDLDAFIESLPPEVLHD